MVELTFDSIDETCVNTIRTLAMEAVEKANSGHPGAPMGLAPVAHVLFNRMLKISPDHPEWDDRDRFILSCGHASALLYSVLHLAGYSISLDDLENFRQWGSTTAGHPEYEPALGIEMTTGPLGQGLATSVGFALAEAHLAARFNTETTSIVDHHTWVLCGDGDLMEGISAEAGSMAGHLGLGKLIWIWDDNSITIEGQTDISVSEDIPARFRAQGWHVVIVDDANDLEAVARALHEAKSTSDRPSFVAIRSHIAYGAPTKQDTASAHGAPLGPDEIRGAKEFYGWPVDSSFLVPDEVRERYATVTNRGRDAHAAWLDSMKAYADAQPEKADEWRRRWAGDLPADWTKSLPEFETTASGPATRAASGTVLNSIESSLPELIGGSADLAPSCKTTLNSSEHISRGEYGHRNIHFGVREHAMGAILNGLSLHGGLRPLGSTFLVFADYMRPAIRLAALMRQPVVFVFTHDSVWVGEDGPTHQPIEQLTSLRLIPGLVVLRPADANETAAAWELALNRREGPSVIILSRQKLPILQTSSAARSGVPRGAHTIADPPAAAISLLASGSEVALAHAAAERLRDEENIEARIVSMPSWELFDSLSSEDRAKLLGPQPRLAIEAGVGRGWRDYVGDHGRIVAIDRFGASAPGRTVAEKLGLNTEHIVQHAIDLVRSDS